MDKGRLRQVLLDQQEVFNKQEQLIERKVNLTSALKGKEIIVIAGIRTLFTLSNDLIIP